MQSFNSLKELNKFTIFNGRYIFGKSNNVSYALFLEDSEIDTIEITHTGSRHSGKILVTFLDPAEFEIDGEIYFEDPISVIIDPEIKYDFRLEII